MTSLILSSVCSLSLIISKAHKSSSPTQKCPEEEKSLLFKLRVRRHETAIHPLCTSKKRVIQCSLSAHHKSCAITLPRGLFALSHFNLPSNPLQMSFIPVVIAKIHATLNDRVESRAQDFRINPYTPEAPMKELVKCSADVLTCEKS